MVWVLLAVSLCLTALGYWHGLSLSVRAFEIGFLYPPRSDEGQYWHMAKQLLEGNVVAERGGYVSYRSVVYGASLAPILWVFGAGAEGIRACRVFQVALAALLPFLAALLALQLAGWRRRGYIAAMIVLPAVAWNDLTWVSAKGLYGDTHGAVLLLVGCVLLFGALASPRRQLWALAAGVALGTAALIEFALLPAVLLACGHLVYRTVRQSLRYRAPGEWPSLRLPGVALVATLGALVVVAALGLRNQAHTGQFFISSKGGVNFYIGNHEHANGRYTSVSFKKAPEGELERNRYFWRKARLYLAKQPGHFAAGLWDKWERLQRELGKQYVVGETRLGLLARLLLYGLLANGLVPLVAPLCRQRLAEGFLGVLVLVNVALVVLVFVYWRYVLSVVLLGPVLACVLALRWGEWGWQRRECVFRELRRWARGKRRTSIVGPEP